MSEPSVMEQITKILTEFHVAKSRRSNTLNETERENLLNQLEEILRPIIEEANKEETTSEPKVTQTTPLWVGESKRDEIRIEAEKKAEILDAWVDEFGISKDSVLTAHIGNRYFYAAPAENEEDSHELWVEKVA